MSSWHCTHLPLQMKSDTGYRLGTTTEARRARRLWQATRIAAAKVERYVRGEKLVNVTHREEVGDYA